MTVRKIKIHDVDNLRSELDSLYEKQDPITLAKWSIEMANRIIEVSGLIKSDYPEIEQSFEVNKEWQLGQVRMHDVRQAGFIIHRIAREQKDEIKKNVFRTIGQAVGSGHMREHAMVTSDYAIKVINLMFIGDTDRVAEERHWQISRLLLLAKQND